MDSSPITLEYQFSPLQPEDVERVITWRYPHPYQIYSLTPEDRITLLNPAYRYHGVRAEGLGLVGICCFGDDARVEGGEYGQGEPEVLDVGIGLRPDLTGSGLGRGFVSQVLRYGARQYRPRWFRATIAAFNHRSRRTFQGLGFQEEGRFMRFEGELRFVQYRCPAGVWRKGGIPD